MSRCIRKYVRNSRLFGVTSQSLQTLHVHKLFRCQLTASEELFHSTRVHVASIRMTF